MKDQASPFEQQRRNKRVTGRKSGTAATKGDADRAERIVRAQRKNRLASLREREAYDN